MIKPLKEALFPQGPVLSIGMSVETGVKTAIKQLESIQAGSEDLERGIQFLKSCDGRVYKDMQDLVEPGRGKFDVLTHGDCWNNNVMFKHDPASGKVDDVKLLDFQMARHVSPAIDIHYFIYSSPKSSVIAENYEDLVTAYYTKFLEILTEKSVPQVFLSQLTIGWLKNELKIYSKYGLFTSCWIANAVLAEDHELIDMDNLTMKHIEEMKTKEVTIVPKLADRLRCILEDYARRYI